MSGIRVELQLEDGSFTTGMLRAGQTVAEFRRELARTDPHFRKMSKGGEAVEHSVRRADVAGRGFLQTFRDISVIAGATAIAFRALTGSSSGLVGEIIKVNAEMERLQYQMQGMSVSANPIREAATSVEWLRKKATEAPFSLNQMAGSFVKLKATGVDPMAKSMQALMDGIAAFGGTDEHLHRVTLGIVQMSGKSVIQMEEMRQQLGESMPNAMRLMARSMGVSVAELTKAISTGRVESSAALNAFYDELERTYGGEAQRMMETFSGQVSQLKANLQILATGEGLKGFFEEQKSALSDLNEFLQTDRAKEFAKSLGEGLSATVRFVRRTVEVLYEMRTELTAVAKIIGLGLGIKVFTSSISKMTTAMRLASISIAAFSRSSVASAATMRTGIAGMTAGTATAGSFRLAMAGARGAVVGLGAAVGVAAPWLVIIGGALSLAAGKMGSMSGETDRAYESLLRYGAETKKQANNVLANEEKRIIKDLKQAESDYWWDFNAARFKKDKLRRIESLRKELEDFKKEKVRVLGEADESESILSVNKFRDSLRIEMRSFTESYRLRQVNLDKVRDLELSRMKDTGKKAFEINNNFQKAKKENEERQINEQLDFIDKKLEEEGRLREKASSDDNRERIDRNVNVLMEERVRIAERLRSVGNFGITFVEDIENDEAKIKRAVKVLDDLQSKIKGIQAEVAGSGSAFAKLQFQIARGDYGSVEQGGETVKRLHEALLEATIQKEALDELMDGRKGLERDVFTAEQKALEKRIELNAKLSGDDGLSEAEKIARKLASGFYKGLGPVNSIREDIVELTGATNVQGEAMNDVGRVIRENAFGKSTLDSINSVHDAIVGVTNAAKGVSAAVTSGEFDSMFSGDAGSFDPSKIPASMVEGIRAAAKELEINPIDLATVISYETGGTFDPRKKGPTTQHGQHRGLIQFGEPQARRSGVDFSSDESAIQSQLGANGGIVKFLRASGFKNGMDLKQLYSTINAGAPGLGHRTDENNGGAPGTVDQKVARMGDHRAKAAKLLGSENPFIFSPSKAEEDGKRITKEALARLKVVAATEEENQALSEQLALQDMMKKLAAEKTGETTKLEEFGKNYASVISAIEEGKFGKDKTFGDAEFAEILKIAKDLDDVEARITVQKKARKEVADDIKSIEEQSADINKRIIDQQRLAKDPNYVAQSDDLKRLNVELDEYVGKVELAYGSDSTEYAAAIAQRKVLLGEQGRLEATTRQAEFSKQARDVRTSLLSQGEQRAAAFRKNIADVDAWIKAARAAGLREVDIVREAEEMKSAIRQQYQEETNPVVGQMREWRDLSKNLMDQTTGWMDSIATGLTGMITGTGDLKGAIDGMINGLVNTYMKFLISSVGGDKASAGAGKLGQVGSKGAGAGSSLGKLVGVAHTGGIAGGSLRMRGANAGMFTNAPKFHTGGIAGMLNTGPKLTNSEIPIIAKKGEGIFTREQMGALAPVGSGSMGGVSINAPITVNGSAGTPEQNDDLSKKMAREMEGSMRSVVVDELRRQMRNGNMLGRK